MSEPELTDSLIDLSGIKYKLSHGKAFVELINQPNDSHIHDFIEIYLNISGDVSFLVKNSIYPINSGDIILTRASDVHHCIYHKSCLHEHFCLWISQSCCDNLVSFINASNANHIVFKAENKKEIIELFYQAEKALQKDDSLSSCTCILRILTILQKQLKEEPYFSDKEVIPKDFKEILDYIDLNYSDLKNIQELTDIFFISISTLNRRFAEYLHISPKSYLDSVKLSNAKRMLIEGKSVTKVCNECGYSDSSHFIRCFKKRFNITPHKFKYLLKVDYK